jgi:hypothetical protein
VAVCTTAPPDDPGSEPEGGQVPKAFLASIRPNPFNPRTEISFELPAAGPIVVTVMISAGGSWPIS